MKIMLPSPSLKFNLLLASQGVLEKEENKIVGLIYQSKNGREQFQ